MSKGMVWFWSATVEECQVWQRYCSGRFWKAMAGQIRAMEERGAAKQGRGGATMRNAKPRQSTVPSWAVQGKSEVTQRIGVV